MKRWKQTVRRLLVLALAAYVAWLAFGYTYHFIDGVNLLIHEAGHVVFSPFGQTMAVAGGTLLQLAFPLAFVAYFFTRGQRFEAAICAVWASESLMYTARYLGDAEARVLPLIGGHLHDWTYLLGLVGLVGQAEAIGTGVHVAASLAAIVCVWWAWTEA
jgi:hypothetical protein